VTTVRAGPRLFLVRHGETEWSSLGRHTGRTDVPLTEHGRAQALALRAKLAGRRFARVLTSPRSRAHETCRIIGLADAAEVEPDLAEWDYGVYEGRLTLDIRETIPGWSVWTHPIEDGEAVEDVGARADRVIARIEDTDGDVALFGHGHQLRILGARWIGLEPAAGRRFALATATLSVLGWERETRVLESWNEACDVPRN
jgi:probable phosphoglycerate mutase